MSRSPRWVYRLCYSLHYQIWLFTHQPRFSRRAYLLFLQVSCFLSRYLIIADDGHSEGRDCIGNAKTGSGKTIAFALPILQKLSVDPYGIFALVLTPTRYRPLFLIFPHLLNGHRELAFQIAEQFVVLGSLLNVRTAVIVGGMDMIAQAIELDNRPHVVVATPGRLVDHLRSSHTDWDLSRVKFLVSARGSPDHCGLFMDRYTGSRRSRQTACSKFCG
jgi:hypothetical protein